MDATYRSDLRELNETNFARFDAKLEQRLTELRAELKGDIASLRGELATFEARAEARADRTDSHLQRTLREQMKWFIVAWVAQFAAVVGLWFRHA